MKVTLTNKKGLHARPAGRIAALASDAKAELTLAYDGKVADASSLLDILLLAAPYKAEIELRAKGDDAENLIAQVVTLIRQKFNEEDQ